MLNFATDFITDRRLFCLILCGVLPSQRHTHNYVQFCPWVEA